MRRKLAIAVAVLASSLYEVAPESAAAYNCTGTYASRYRGITTTPDRITNIRGAYSVITIRRPQNVCDIGTHAQNQPVRDEVPHDVNSPPLNFSMATVVLADCVDVCSGTDLHWLVQSGYIRWWGSGTYHFGEYKYQNDRFRRICFVCGVLPDGGQNAYWAAVVSGAGYAVVDATIMLQTPPGQHPSLFEPGAQFFAETKYSNTDIPGRTTARAHFLGLYWYDSLAWHPLPCGLSNNVSPSHSGWAWRQICETHPMQLEVWDPNPAA